MAEASGAVRALFEAYARATDSTDPAFFATAYGETFMFAGPATVQAVKRDDFLKVVPKRRAFFATVGLAATKVSSIDESPLDEHHLLVRVRWTFRFERNRSDRSSRRAPQRMFCDGRTVDYRSSFNSIIRI
jgi:hypothetical protein